MGIAPHGDDGLFLFQLEIRALFFRSFARYPLWSFISFRASFQSSIMDYSAGGSLFCLVLNRNFRPIYIRKRTRKRVDKKATKLESAPRKKSVDMGNGEAI